MSRDFGGHGVQVVAGSNPACPTKSNPFPQNNLAVAPSPRPSPVSAEVSNRASNSRREETVSRRLERDSRRCSVCRQRRGERQGTCRTRDGKVLAELSS